ncbi:hypothetical protein BGZ52_003727 [Haplosporangium bisporale]|nr:hypothetical protein BGZ52_003727 [Haplosporangium bisporale]
MDSPIEGDKYVRTLSHYLRSNQRRLLPQPPTNGNATARAILTPGDPMAAAYQSMMSSLWSATTSVVNSITPPDDTPNKDLYNGAWDGTGSIAPDTPREQQLHLQAQLKAPILPLDLYYLMYILERFEQVGIELDHWDGLTPRTVGDSTPRVIAKSHDHGVPTTNTSASFPPTSTRPQSIRSFQSTAISTLTLITGWKQWSTAASSQENITIADDIHFIHRFMKKVPGLRLVSKIPPGIHVQGKGRIEGYSADAILNLFSTGQSGMSKPVQLPVFSLFPALTHLEIHKIPPRCIDGWEVLMKQLRSLVVAQADIEDVYDVMVTAVVDSERRRRQRLLKEHNRVVQIKQEQQEALKEAALVSKEIDTIQEVEEEEEEGETEDTTTPSEGDKVGSMSASSSMIPSISLLEEELDDSAILASLKMWPQLRHLSLTDNGFPALAHNSTFSYTHSVVSLDLSHNLLLSPPSGLIHLHNLHELNLSYNMISGVQSIYQILGNISVLDLRGNRLESLSGLERLWNLEKVDVRENHLDEAAEVGRLAALPQIREVWAEKNPFCVIQQKHRLEILAVFKANGHDLLLDGTFASFTERRFMANLSPSSFSTTISSVNNVANIPAASAPAATLSKELAPQQHFSGEYRTRPVSWHVSGTSPPMVGPVSPVSKLVKKKLMKASNRVKRVVNLDSDHEEDNLTAVDEGEAKGMEILLSDGEVSPASPRVSILGSPAAIKKPKKKKSPKGTPDATPSPKDDETLNSKASLRVKKKAPKKKSINFVVQDSANSTTNTAHSEDHATSHATHGDDEDHSLCRDGHHVHRLAHLERSLATVQFERPSSSNYPKGSSPNEKMGHHMRHPSRGILKRAQTMGVGATTGIPSGPTSPRGPLRPSSPIGSMSSEDGADGYRRRIEAMRNEAGSNWLKVLAEMEKDVLPLHTRDDSHL